MYAADQVYTARQTLYLMARGDTTNPNHDLQTAPLSNNEHYVSDTATQQDGVPQVTSDTLALPLPSSCNLPTDYDQPQRSHQQTSTGHTSLQAQTTTLGATAQQNTGETFSVPSQEGRYRDIVCYTNGSQLYDVVQQLKALLIKYGPTNVTIGNFMYQVELDAFFRDGKEADFSSAPNVLDSSVYLDCTYYEYKTEIDFPHLHIDCDSAEEEDLEDTLPYEDPPPPYHSARNNQTNAGIAAQQSNLHVTSGRQSLLNDPLQAHVISLPQLDGPLEGTKQYVSTATSPSQWREYPLNSAGSQVANWDSTGDRLYQTQSSIAEIQQRDIDYHQDSISNCRDSVHCTNSSTLAQTINSLDPQDTDDLYTDDNTESYDTMDTHMRPEDDFFYCRYTQNLNNPQVGVVSQNTFCFGKQADDTNRDLYAGNNRGAGHGAARCSHGNACRAGN